MNHSCALITGASSGLGEEFARQLARSSAALVLVARRQEKLEEIAAELETSFPTLTVHVRTVDLSDEAERLALVSSLEEDGLLPDLLVNNAGLGDYGSFVAADWEKTQTMMEVNMQALTHLCHAFLPHMILRGTGAIINVSSLASTLPIPDFTVYAATKAYVTSFSEALRLELRDAAIPVLAVCPGPVHTEFGSVAKREGESSDFGPRELIYVDKKKVVSTALSALARDKARVYPGLLVAAAAVGISLLPMCAIRLVMGRRPRRVLPE